MQEGRTENEQMISEERLKEIAALPSQRDLAESDDQEANYRVGKQMAEAIRELLQERRSGSPKIDLWRKYVELLGKEIEEMAPFADMRGWKSTRFEEGRKLREQLGLGEFRQTEKRPPVPECDHVWRQDGDRDVCDKCGTRTNPFI